MMKNEDTKTGGQTTTDISSQGWLKRNASIIAILAGVAGGWLWGVLCSWICTIVHINWDLLEHALVSLVQAIAWPTAILIALALFRAPLTRFLKRGWQFTAQGVEAKVERDPDLSGPSKEEVARVVKEGRDKDESPESIAETIELMRLNAAERRLLAAMAAENNKGLGLGLYKPRQFSPAKKTICDRGLVYTVEPSKKGGVRRFFLTEKGYKAIRLHIERLERAFEPPNDAPPTTDASGGGPS